MATEKQTQERVEELEYALRCFVNMARAVRTDMANPERVSREITSHEERIAWHYARIAEARERLEHGPELLETYTKKIASLQKRIKRVKAANQIEKLRRMQQELQALMEEVPKCQTILNFGEGKARVCGGIGNPCDECRKLRATEPNIPAGLRGKARQEAQRASAK